MNQFSGTVQRGQSAYLKSHVLNTKIVHQARNNLLSEQGRLLRIQRNVEVESVFGQIKHNMRFRRFNLRGLEKVKTEWGLVCIAHNMRKLAG